ncbi:MAG: FAD-dependent oxidoreductase [Petrimonas sp.]|nr:FAD-dependent oxidoreductase [Petrimonas sp.]
MKLRTPEAFWLLKNGILNSYPSLKKDIQCDIVVIGGGITGSLISHALLKAGYDTVVIDKRDIGTGSTAATTSMLQYEIDMPMVKLSEMIGTEGAILCYKAGIDSLNILSDLVKKENLDAGFETKKSLQIAHSEYVIKDLKREYEFRKKYGLKVEWVTSEDIKRYYKMDSYPGILSENGASIDAFQFTQDLFSKNSQRGLRIYDHTLIKKINFGNPVVIITEEGFKVICKRVIFCTGFETFNMFRKRYANIVSTFACVSEQNFNLYDELKDLLIWDTGTPYIYMRTTDDKRLLVGGEDLPYRNSNIRDKIKNQKARKLLDKTKRLFPSLYFQEDYNWTGAFGTTKDSLPYIGEHPDFKNAVFVLGLGGNGITFSVQGMALVLKILAGEYDPLIYYYRFNR